MRNRPLTLARPRKRRQEPKAADVLARILLGLAASTDPLVNKWAGRLIDGESVSKK
jgi:hypothetical protein